MLDLNKEVMISIIMGYLIIVLVIYFSNRKDLNKQINKKIKPVKSKGIVKRITQGKNHDYIYTIQLNDSKENIESIGYYIKYNCPILEKNEEVEVEVYEAKKGKICKILSKDMVPIHNYTISISKFCLYIMCFTIVYFLLMYIVNKYPANASKKILIICLIIAIPILLIRVFKIIHLSNKAYKKGKEATAIIIKKEAIVPYNETDYRAQDRFYFEIELQDGTILKSSLFPVNSDKLQKLKVGDKVEIYINKKRFLFKEFTDNYIKEKNK